MKLDLNIIGVASLAGLLLFAPAVSLFIITKSILALTVPVILVFFMMGRVMVISLGDFNGREAAPAGLDEREEQFFNRTATNSGETVNMILTLWLVTGIMLGLFTSAAAKLSSYELIFILTPVLALLIEGFIKIFSYKKALN